METVYISDAAGLIYAIARSLKKFNEANEARSYLSGEKKGSGD